jgi:small subunit ribosomal protein S16
MAGEHAARTGPLTGSWRVPRVPRPFSPTAAAPHPANDLEKHTLVATKIRLLRLGKIRAPYYRIVVADSRTKRDGRVIETIGKYHPKSDPSFIEVDSARAQHWLSVGAQPTEPVTAILKITGDWQRFKGLPEPSEGVKTAAPKPDRKAAFEAAAKESLADAEAKPARKTAAKKAAAAEPEATPAAEAAAEAEPAAEPEAAPAAEPEAAPAAEAVAEPEVPAEAAAEPEAAPAAEAAAEPEATAEPSASDS